MKITQSQIQNKESICDLAWIKRNKPINKKFLYKRQLNIIDLFCGCGGISLGIEESLNLNQIKSNFILALDSNKSALEVFEENINIEKNCLQNIDIQKLMISTNIKQIYDEVDLLVAGPPCQGHSSLNNHTRSKDQKNLLYLETIRFIELTMPKVAIIENVANVINDNQKVVQKAKQSLSALGYEIQELNIDAHIHFGLPQTRKRHLLIAILGETFNTSNIISEIKEKHSLKEYIGDIQTEYKTKKEIFYTPSLAKKINQNRIKYLFENDLYDLPNEMRPKCHQKNHSYKSMYGRLNWVLPAQTITSGFGSMGQGRYIHPSEPRTITPHESARIQGFPDFFSFNSVQSRVQLQTMIANAVPPKIMAVITNELIQQGVL